MDQEVTACVCFDMTFEEWLRLKRQRRWTMQQAARHTLCGEGCGMCKRYLRVVDATGLTSLPLLIPEELESQVSDTVA